MCMCVDGMAAQWAATPMNIRTHSCFFFLSSSGFSETHPKFYYWRSLKAAQTKWKMRTIYSVGFCMRAMRLDTATLWLTYPRCAVHVIYNVRRPSYILQNVYTSIVDAHKVKTIRFVWPSEKLLAATEHRTRWIMVIFVCCFTYQLCNYFRFLSQHQSVRYLCDSMCGSLEWQMTKNHCIQFVIISMFNVWLCSLLEDWAFDLIQMRNTSDWRKSFCHHTVSAWTYFWSWNDENTNAAIRSNILYSFVERTTFFSSIIAIS